MFLKGEGNMVVRITGGLGNQMFQYAFAKAMQHDLNIESLQLDIEFFHDNNVHNGFELEKIFHTCMLKCI